jgi:hypothetical protein
VGVTASTPTNIVIGAGNVHRNHANLGASTGDNVFTITRTIFTPQLNGLKGSLLGTDYITNSEAMLATSIPEVSGPVMSAGWPGSSTTGNVAGMEVIDEDDTRRIPTTDYADWELQVERLGGGQFQFEVDNAINRANLELSGQDAGMMAPRYELHGSWDPAALTVSPHRIRILDVAS